MQLYLDTADVDRIREAVRLGVVDGVTTNPAIAAGVERPYRATVAAIDEVIDGPVFVQTLADDADGMVREARAYQDWAGDVVAKLPATHEGFAALARLRADGVPAGTTVVFSVEQAVLAAKNDASFVAPYVGRLDDAGRDGVATAERIRSVYDAQGFETDVLAASVRNTTQAVALAEAGVDAITLAPDVLDAHVADPGTDEGVAGFAAAWGDRPGPLEE